jgi:hypothetical protein
MSVRSQHDEDTLRVHDALTWISRVGKATPHKWRMVAKQRRSGNKSISDKMVPSFQYRCDGRSFLGSGITNR